MILDPDWLTMVRKRAHDCDDEIRRRRGQLPRPTRCASCTTILTLLAYIELSRAARSSVAGPPGGATT